jgi:alpha-tubulin suppressor-like RCC1 family protein
MLLTKWLLSLQGPGTPPATDGLLYVTGINTFGQVGNGNFIDQAYFQQIGTRSWNQVVVGSSHTLAIRSDGKLFTWGSNDVGQLGNDDPYLYALAQPYQIGNSSWSQVASKEKTSYGITSDGKLFAWGNAISGQIGNDSLVYPGGSKSWNQIESGTQFTVGITKDGALWTWGLGTNGVLGLDSIVARSSAVQVGTSSWVSVATGASHVVGLDTDGRLFTWGLSTFGRLGDGFVITRSSPVQVGSNSWVYVAAGDTHSAAIDLNKLLFVWGDNLDGAIGDGSIVNRSSPVQVTSINSPEDEVEYAAFKGEIYNSNWSVLSSGNGNHFLGIKSNYRVLAWGQGTSGQIGNSDSVNQSNPIALGVGTKSWSHVAAGLSHSAAIDSTGTLYTWGNNSTGQLGDSSTAATSSPVVIGFSNDPGYYSGFFDGNGDFLNISSNPVLALATGDFTLECWIYATQYNPVFNNAILDFRPNNTNGAYPALSFGRVGITFSANNTAIASDPTVPALNTWYHVAVVRSGTTITLYVDGVNKATGTLSTNLLVGQLLIGGNAFRSSVPLTYHYGYINNVRVVKGTAVYTASFTPPTAPLTAITNTSLLTCQDSTFIDNSTNALSITSVGNVKTDSFNPYGDIGTVTTWNKISAGGAFTLGIQDNNKLYAWGLATGGLLADDSSAGNKSSPVQIGNSSWSLISAGLSHSLGTNATGQLFAWGLATNGKLGTGDTFNKSNPVQITSLTSPEEESIYATKVGYTETLSWNQIVAGDSFFAAIRSDSKLFTWGINTSGQLGLNNTNVSYLPTKVGDSSWTSVSAGASHVLGLSDNKLFAWGLNTSGQLGDYSVISKSSPTQVGLPNTGTKYKSIYFNGATSYLRADTALDSLTTTSGPFTVEFWFYDSRTNSTAQAFLGINRTSDSQNTMVILTNGTGGTMQILFNNTDIATPPFEQNIWNHVAFSYDGAVMRVFLNGVSVGERTQVINTAPANCALAIGAEADAGLVYGDFVIGNVSNFRVSNVARYTTAFTPDTSPFVVDANTLFLTAQESIVDETATHDITILGTPIVIGSNPFGIASYADSWTQISAGNNHGAGVISDGRLYTWGLNSSGQLGADYTSNYFAPLKIGNSSWTLVSAGATTTLATTSNHTLYTWGLGTSGQIGVEDIISRSSPVQVTSLLSEAAINDYASIVGDATPYKSWISVSSGYENTAGIDLANKLFLWGRNDFGQLGFGNTSLFVNFPTKLDDSSWTMISPGDHTLGIKSNGTLWAWGLNTLGQLGTGDTVSRSSPVQIGTSSWTMISVSTTGFTLAIRADGALFTWGNGALGRLGDSTTISKSSPIQIGANSWTSISAGTSHAAAIDINGSLWTWGLGTSGQLGDSTSVTKSSPVLVSGTDSWIQVSAGSDRTFGITTLNELYAWGSAANGSLGLGNVTNRNTPGRVGLSSWIMVSSANSSNNAYGITVDNLLFSWGFGGSGRLWNSSTITRSSPVQVGTSSWSLISGGYIGAAGLLTNNLLYTGGLNTSGEQGRVTLVSSTSSPAIVGAITDSWNAISAGNGHTLAIRSEGSLWAWGLGTNGQLGDNTLTSVSQPTKIGASSWTTISAGNLFSVGISDNNLYAWGINSSSQLGDNTVVRKSSPVLVDSSGWTQVYAATTTGVGVKNNSMYIWGTNITDSNTDVPGVVTNTVPRHVPSINDSFTFINAGTEHSVAIRNDGLLFTWGLNSSGQLGLNDTAPRSLMTQVGSSSFTMALTTTDATVALSSDNKLFAFGNNSVGQLGQGDQIDRSSPVQVGSNSWITIGTTNSAIAAVDTTNKLYTWGGGSVGEQGTLRTAAINTSPSFVKTINDSWTVVTSGTDTTYAIRDDGLLYAWGLNSSGQLGVNNTINTIVPVKIGTSSWQLVKAGGAHVLAYGGDKLLYSWGLNNVGQLGDGTLVNKSSPVQVSNITANGYWSVSFDGTEDYIDVPNDTSNQLSGSVYTIEMWIYPNTTSGVEDGPRFFNKNGSATFGYLVYLGTNNRVSFRTDNTNMNAGTINATANTWSHIAVTNDGTTTRIFVNGQLSQSATGVVITSGNEQGVLRIGARQFNATQPLTGYLSNVRLVKGTALYTANFTVPTTPLTAITDTSLLTCNTPIITDESINNLSLSVVGDTYETPDNPFSVSPTVGVSVKNISAGLSHNLLIGIDNKLYAWGLGTSGQLGTGRVNSARYITPIGSESWVGLGTNSTQSFAIRNDNAGYATGLNTAGQLGLINPSTTAPGSTWLVSRSSFTQIGLAYFSNSPVQVGSSSWTQVSAGEGFVTALRSDKLLFTWGINSNYQLGLGDNITRSSPVQVNSLSWNQVSAGASHVLAIDTQSSLYGWGLPYESNLLPAGPSTSWAAFSTNTTDGHSVALDSEGRVFVWGSNSFGQLGLDDVISRSIPVQLGTDTWLNVYAGSDLTFLIRNDYKLFAMGNNLNGRLGTGDTNTYSSPVQIGSNSWTQISTLLGTLGIDSLGRLWAWGNNSFGVLGLNNQINSSSPVQVGASSWTQVSVGLSHTAAIRLGGGLFTWGAGANGRLGSNAVANRSSPVQVGASSWTQISAGDDFTAGIRLGGSLFTWGANATGQLWTGNTTARSSPGLVGTSSWTQISAGAAQLYGISASRLFAGGAGAGGRLGDNTVVNRLSPVQIGSNIVWGTLPNIRNVNAMLAADSRGFLYAWGSNVNGQLGDSTLIAKSSPVQIGFTFPRKISTMSWSQISAGYSHSLGISINNLMYGWGNFAANQFETYSWREITAGPHTAAIRSDYKLFVWGLNSAGQIGDNTRLSRSSPVQIGTDSWVQINTGALHTVGVKSNGTLWTWGEGANGRLGSNSQVDRSSPVQVGTSVWTQIKAGTAHTIGIDGNNRLFTWGLGSSGELGTGTTVARSSPVQIGTDTWIDISAGNALSLGITTTGALFAWGLGTLGEMGDDTAISKSSPIQIGTSSWAQISAGSNHAGAITIDNKLFMWGANSVGQLGDDTTINKSSPVQIGTMDWYDVNAGASFTMATSGTRMLFGWGLNTSGQIGDTSRENRSSPVQLGTYSWGMVGATDNTVAMKINGTLWSWGVNTNGQVGLSDRVNRSSPTQIGTAVDYIIDYSPTANSAITQIGTSSWSQVTAGNDYSYAINLQGVLFGWGASEWQPYSGTLTDVGYSAIQVDAGRNNAGFIQDI